MRSIRGESIRGESSSSSLTHQDYAESHEPTTGLHNIDIYSQSSLESIIFPSFTVFERVTFGKECDSYFRIRGISSLVMVDRHPHKPAVFVPQLVLQVTSAASAGIFCRSLRRCLLATVSLGDEAVDRRRKRRKNTQRWEANRNRKQYGDDQRAVGVINSKTDIDMIYGTDDNDAYTRNMEGMKFDCPNDDDSTSNMGGGNDDSGVEGDLEVVWVPGAGAAEMGWSVLWGEVARELKDTSRWTHGVSSYVGISVSSSSRHADSYTVNPSTSISASSATSGMSPPSSSSTATKKHSPQPSSTMLITPNTKSFGLIASELAKVLSTSIVNNCRLKTQNIDRAMGLIHRCSLLCQMISSAYLTVPTQLVSNATATTSAPADDVANSYSFNNGTTNCLNKNGNLILHEWKTHYTSISGDLCPDEMICQHQSTENRVNRVENLNAVRNTFPSLSGRLGLVLGVNCPVFNTSENAIEHLNTQSLDNLFPLFGLRDAFFCSDNTLPVLTSATWFWKGSKLSSYCNYFRVFVSFPLNFR